MSDNALSRRLREIREAETPPEAELELEPAQDEREEPTPLPPGRRPLGELLVGKGLVSRAALEAALEQQRLDGRPLGQILVAAGELTPQNLARTLTGQHGFDFSATSLRDRLATGEDDGQELRPRTADEDERYLLLDGVAPEPLHVATSFIDAADVAFELIDARNPEELEIVRLRGGERDQLWSYRKEPAGFSRRRGSSMQVPPREPLNRADTARS
jgi:hypothetical protein